ncbi:hypothetical protein FS837_001142 [Tulasnella sp. UAMH 9824]|nr:hypothetical protein FS837_001142 [Tulasnella sp. UAMH 9824]
MLAVVPPQITTARLDGPANPITPVVTAPPPAPQTTDPPAAVATTANTPDASNIATSPSTSAAPSPSKNKSNSKSGATAGGAGTASTAAPLTAVGSQDSIPGSWSTLSIPKSSAGTATNGGKAASRKSKGKSSSPQPTGTTNEPYVSVEIAKGQGSLTYQFRSNRFSYARARTGATTAFSAQQQAAQATPEAVELVQGHKEEAQLRGEEAVDALPVGSRSCSSQETQVVVGTVAGYLPVRNGREREPQAQWDREAAVARPTKLEPF